uniref:Uncharacterized protein n=1 Tax=Peronospora matthiolae TaxID=2874970 RepID=A0AAV1UQZ1_9STRA
MSRRDRIVFVQTGLDAVCPLSDEEQTFVQRDMEYLARRRQSTRSRYYGDSLKGLLGSLYHSSGVQLATADLVLDHVDPDAAAPGATTRKLRTTKRLLMAGLSVLSEHVGASRYVMTETIVYDVILSRANVLSIQKTS